MWDSWLYTNCSSKSTIITQKHYKNTHKSSTCVSIAFSMFEKQYKEENLEKFSQVGLVIFNSRGYPLHQRLEAHVGVRAVYFGYLARTLNEILSKKSFLVWCWYLGKFSTELSFRYSPFQDVVFLICNSTNLAKYFCVVTLYLCAKLVQTITTKGNSSWDIPSMHV